MNDKSLWVIFFLLIISFSNDLYGLFLLKNNSKNYISFNIFILVETLLLDIYFFKILFFKLLKKIIFTTCIIFLLFWLFKFVIDGKKTFLYSCASLENITILAFAIFFYYEQIVKVNLAFIYKEVRFWIVSAYFIYIAGTFFLLLYFPSLNLIDLRNFYILNYIFIIIRTVLLSIAMCMNNDSNQKQKFKLA